MPTTLLAKELHELLGSRVPPIAIAFRADPPAGVKRIDQPAPAGCGYWRAAGEGKTFYTEASDHFGCPVGAYTHSVPLPPEKAAELQSLIGTMVGLEYLRMEEVPAIPTMPTPFKFAVYSPLADAPCEPDVVLVRGNARVLMLLSEAAASAGVAGGMPTAGRPTCAVLPMAVRSQGTASSFGCVGNRVYTGASEDEAYFAIPGDKLALLVERLRVIARANEALDTFHKSRAGTA